MTEIIAIILGLLIAFGIGFGAGAEYQAGLDCKARGGVPVKFQCFKPDSELK